MNNTNKNTIEGKWKDPETEIVVLIYKKDNKIFGKLISARNENENNKIQKGKTIDILKGFEQKNETDFCCGTFFLSHKKLTAKGCLTLLDKATLQIEGKCGIFSHQMIWERLSS